MAAKLTDKQQRFCEEYLVDLNATQAAIRAGYSVKNADKIGSQLIGKTRVSEEIQRLQNARSARTQIDADYVLEKLRAIADSTIADYIEFDGERITFKDFGKLTPAQLSAIESIKRGANGIELKLHGKSWTMEMIAKHIGFYEKDNSQKNPDEGIDYDKLSPATLAELLHATSTK